MPDSKMALSTRPDIGQHRKPEMSATEPEVETGSGNSTRTASVSDAILTATPTFSTMADSEMSLPTRPDIGRHRKPEMSATEPEVEITMNEKSWRCDSNDLAHIFDRTKLKYGTADTVRNRPISVTQNVDENRK